MAQIGLATQSYAIDFKGFLPPAKTHTPSISWPYPDTTAAGAYYRGYLPLVTHYEGPFMCPVYNHEGIEPKVQVAGVNDAKVSYTYNLAVGWENALNTWQYYPALQVDAVRKPTEKAYLVDGLYRDATKTWYALDPFSMDYLTSGTAVSGAMMNRHPGDTNNMLYFDNHATAVQGQTFDGNDLIRNIWTPR